MRQTYAPRLGDDARQLGVAAERGHVVDHLDAELERAARDGGLRRVDRDRHAREPLEDGHDPAKLLVGRDRLGTRAGRLAADVDDRRALLSQPPPVRDRVPRAREAASVREAVGRDVDDAHDRRPRPALLERLPLHARESTTVRESGKNRPPMSTPSANTGPLGQRRGILFVLLISLITIGIYTIYWAYKTHEEMKQHTGDGLGGVLGLVIWILLNPVSAFVIPSEVGKMYAARGRTSPITRLDRASGSSPSGSSHPADRLVREGAGSAQPVLGEPGNGRGAVQAPERRVTDRADAR